MHGRPGELVGSTGSVTAYEIEADLAERAATNLRHLRNVTVAATTSTDGLLSSADLIYVNAGATHPLALWLDAPSDRGRLMFPLTPNEGFGCMLLVTRSVLSSQRRLLREGRCQSATSSRAASRRLLPLGERGRTAPLHPTACIAPYEAAHCGLPYPRGACG